MATLTMRTRNSAKLRVPPLSRSTLFMIPSRNFSTASRSCSKSLFNDWRSMLPPCSASRARNCAFLSKNALFKNSLVLVQSSFISASSSDSSEISISEPSSESWSDSESEPGTRIIPREEDSFSRNGGGLSLFRNLPRFSRSSEKIFYEKLRFSTQVAETSIQTNK